jgi:hypothetical protein
MEPIEDLFLELIEEASVENLCEQAPSDYLFQLDSCLKTMTLMFGTSQQLVQILC